MDGYIAPLNAINVYHLHWRLTVFASAILSLISSEDLISTAAIAFTLCLRANTLIPTHVRRVQSAAHAMLMGVLPV